MFVLHDRAIDQALESVSVLIGLRKAPEINVPLGLPRLPYRTYSAATDFTSLRNQKNGVSVPEVHLLHPSQALLL